MQCIWLFGAFLCILGVAAKQLESYQLSHALHIEEKKNKIGADDILLNGKTSSKIQCADVCVNSEDCVSFFYNKKSKVCQTHGRGLGTDNGTFIDDDGSRYYRLTNRQLVGENCMDSKQCIVERSECNNGQCVCVDGYVYRDDKRSCEEIYIDCYDALFNGKNVSGVYYINNSGVPKAVYCDQTTDGGGWLVFQRRSDGSEDFYREWNDYAKGFGDINNEFWIGNEFLTYLTNQRTQTLRIDLESFENETRFAQYGIFVIDPASTNYVLHVGDYSGTANDSLAKQNGYQFSTKDRDNDIWVNNCAVNFRGAWWYTKCHDSNLNGFYYGAAHSTYADGVNWRYWLGYYYSLKAVEMKCRPK